MHPLATALATILLAARDAAAAAAAGFRSTARRAARMQVWLGRPEALLFREGCQLLACMIFILLYVWRYVARAMHAPHDCSWRQPEHVRNTELLGLMAVWLPGCVFLSCSTYSPVVHGSGRWWLDLLLSGLFAADYVHRTLVGCQRHHSSLPTVLQAR